MHDHLVEFYETDSLLVESVRNFLLPALTAGDPVLLVATPAHRAGFISALEDCGVNVEEARGRGLFVDLDAADILNRFLVDCSPDPSLFAEVVEGVVASTGNGNPRMRIYGEMVALLWDEGSHEEALVLENMWNDLSDRRQFTLLCAYPLASIEWGPNTDHFRAICSSHSEVKVRFSAPQAEGRAPEPLYSRHDELSGVKGLGFELTALKEVIRNANQMGRLAENKKTVSRSGPSALDYNLTQ